MRRLALALSIVLAFVCSGQASAASATWRSGTANWTAEHALFVSLDAAHVRACGTHLRSDLRLIHEARWRTADMATRGYFGHHIPPTGDYFSAFLGRYGVTGWRVAGEIAHWNEGYRDPEPVAYAAFRNSPPHWAVITSCTFTTVGVGTYQLAGRFYFVADYLRF